MTLRADEFLRRFLQHVLPGGLVRVRHYGLLANRYRAAKLHACRRLLLVVAVATAPASASAVEGSAARDERCPARGGSNWRVVARVPRPSVAQVCRLPLGADTS